MPGAELRVGLSRPLHVVEPGEEGGAQKPRESRPAAPAQVRERAEPRLSLSFCDSVSQMCVPSGSE